ncbi:MAG TPA: hypothetical protein VFJ24_01650 [Gaiellales bacterium]|nr:hypothetical protein [Gaiellales bacterium]
MSNEVLGFIYESVRGRMIWDTAIHVAPFEDGVIVAGRTERTGGGGKQFAFRVGPDVLDKIQSAIDALNAVAKPVLDDVWAAR